MPVHPGRAVVEHLHPVHAHVAHPGFGIDGVHHRQGDERAAVAGPAPQHRQPPERSFVPTQHHLLTSAAPRARTGQPASGFGQKRQQPQPLPQRILRRAGIVEQRPDARADRFERFCAERRGHATRGAHHIGQHRETRPRIFKQQRLAAIRRLAHAVGDLRDLVCGRNGRSDPHQLALAFQPCDKFTQVTIHRPLRSKFRAPGAPSRSAAAVRGPPPRRSRPTPQPDGRPVRRACRW